MYLSQKQSLMVFTARYGDSFSQHWCPRLESLVWGWDFHSSEGPFAAKIPSRFLITTGLVWDLPIPCLHPSYKSQCHFFMSLVIGVLFT